MKIHTDIEQGSVSWLAIRAAKITASEADRLVTPLGKVKQGDGPKSMLMEKLAEKWTGMPLPQVQGVFNLDQGQILEEYARPAFELETGRAVTRVGFIESDDNRCGCSPDGILSDHEGLEIKCPMAPNHIRYLLDGKLPDDYILQVQFSMFVTGWASWKFCSFRRGMSPLILTVECDEKLQSSIEQAVAEFNDQFDASWTKLCELNGGPPPPRPAFVPSSNEKPRFSWEGQTSDVPS